MKVRDDPYPTAHDPNLLQVALNIHMNTVGSFEYNDARADLAFLRKRLRDWKPTGYAPSQAFDDACKALFNVVIADAKKKKGTQ